MILDIKDYTWPMKYDHMKPFSHQKETFMFLLKNRRSYVLSDLGTGKTLSALWAADYLMLNKKIKKVCIVGPLSTLQSVWGQEIFSALRHRKYAIAHGSRDVRIAAIKSNVDFVIINHDGVTVMEDELIKENFDLFIVDELTAFKKYNNERSKSMIRIAKRCEAIWGMTGAPTPNSPVEVFGQARVVNPDNPYLPRYFGEFKSMVVTPLTPFIDVPTPNAVSIVHKILQPAIRFVRDECIDIPPVQYIDVVVPLSKGQLVAYNEMRDKLRIEYEQGLVTASNAAVKMMKLMQISAGSVKDQDGVSHKLDSSPRDDELWRIFEETGHRKLVVGAAFRADIEHLVQYFTKKKVKVACIYGGIGHEDRAKRIRDFQDADLQVLILQPQSSAHGITLTASDTIVWYSLLPSGEVYTQFNGRITRAGQKRKQSIIHLYGTKVERHILSILQKKGNMSSEVLSMFADL